MKTCRVDSFLGCWLPYLINVYDGLMGNSMCLAAQSLTSHHVFDLLTGPSFLPDSSSWSMGGRAHWEIFIFPLVCVCECKTTLYQNEEGYACFCTNCFLWSAAASLLTDETAAGSFKSWIVKVQIVFPHVHKENYSNDVWPPEPPIVIIKNDPWNALILKWGLHQSVPRWNRRTQIVVEGIVVLKCFACLSPWSYLMIAFW